ncbi:MAG: cyclic peptide export ABC transporter [Acidobacteriota bacterium]|nr:cyclic peptide export ABC transporter [Acidobacteriota bacterium]
MIRALRNRYPLVEMLARARAEFDVEFVAATVLAGLGNALVLALVNAAAVDASSRYLALFVLVVAMFLLMQFYVMTRSATEVERTLDRIRTDISDHLARAKLEALERVGRAEIFDCVSRETTIISQAAATITLALQSALMILFSAVYLERLSLTAFVLTIVLSYTGIRVYLLKREESTRLLEQATDIQNEFFECLTHLIDGFKEARLHAARGRELLVRLRRISSDLTTVRVASERSFAAQNAYAQVAFYLMIGGVVFLLPSISPTFPAVVTQATATMLFIIAPLSSLVGSIPVFARANVAATNVLDLERVLARAETHETIVTSETPAVAAPLELRHIAFAYEPRGDERPFAIGPISLRIEPGTVAFFVGGNGSGKSTLLKVLTGLYAPRSGTMFIGGTPFAPETAQWYRSHFTAVFSDYHLFDRLYGMGDIDPARVTAALERLQLQEKVGFEGGRFSTLELSSGQRKRLALAVAILEDRPFLVFDEWAAEQDPTFREIFYREILPWLRAEGRTVIAATHDAQYFDAADQIVRFDMGVIIGSDGTAPGR